MVKPVISPYCNSCGKETGEVSHCKGGPKLPKGIFKARPLGSHCLPGFKARRLFAPRGWSCPQPFLSAPGAWGGLPSPPSSTRRDLIEERPSPPLGSHLLLPPPQRAAARHRRAEEGEGGGGGERKSRVDPTRRAGERDTRQCGTFRHPSATATPCAGRRRRQGGSGRNAASGPRTCPCGLRRARCGPRGWCRLTGCGAAGEAGAGAALPSLRLCVARRTRKRAGDSRRGGSRSLSLSLPRARR